MITEQQRKNLKTLADYLIKLPDDYQHFDMGSYCEEEGGRFPRPENANISECGTVACAAGHGVAAGISPRALESWGNYVERVFCDEDSEEYLWLFHFIWGEYDNTPQGAARRIYYYLENGVPDDFEYVSEELVKLYNSPVTAKNL